MFNTFSTTSDPASAQQMSEDPASGNSRPKRHQVSRACVWCRTYRIKCDAGYPCRNCKAKGRKCAPDKGKDEVRTFPHAIKEIDRLKERVKELEQKLQNFEFNKDAPKTAQDDRKVSPEVDTSLPVNLDPWAQHGGNRKYYNWDVVSTRTSNSNAQTYGPSSSYYFVGQITAYLEAVLQHQNTEIHSACALYSASQSPESNGIIGTSIKPGQPTNEHDLSRPQEEYYLNLYWESYDDVFPILDEDDFKVQYESLWDRSRALRQPSALVDIVLALCMQSESACAVSNDHDTVDVHTCLAGRWFHRRGQQLLSDELEEPSLQTFQCHLLSVVWLSNAGLHNMAHNALAGGIRVGTILGLHLEPSEDLPETQREFRRRLWWTMYVLEMRFAMELGRPLALSFSQVTCSIPNEVGLHMKANSSCRTAFSAHFVRLYLATRAIYVTFYKKCGDVVRNSGYKTLYHDSKSLEECAEFLSSKVGYLHTWVQHVPESLKHERKSQGQVFSTDRSQLDILPAIKRIQARQSIILELLYHNLSMNLYRPFITFSTTPGSATSAIERHAISCVNHAITITSIIYQVLTETNYLDGWLETYQWQWNAALSLIGYLFAYPVGAVAPVARETLNNALHVFDLQSRLLLGAATAATVFRDLISKADLFISHAQASLLLGSTTTIPTISSMPELDMPGMDAFGFEFDFDSFAASSTTQDGGEARSGANQPTLTNASGFSFPSDSFVGVGDVGAEGETMFGFLDLGDGTSIPRW